MGLEHSPKIVTDNLYFCVDAANIKSYPGSGTTWTDMSTGFVGIMSNMTASDYTSGAPDYFTFDNSVDDDDAGHKQSIDITSVTPSISVPPITWVSWLRRKQSCFSTPIGVSDQLEHPGTNWKRYHMRVDNGDKLRYHWNSQSSTYNYNPNIDIPEDEWVMCATSVSSSSATLYMFELDGTISQGTNTLSGGETHVSATYPIPGGPFSIGKIPYEINNKYFGGDIAIIQIYSKALSEAELKQNYDATKTRFGS